jgi:hypothetical protein
VPAGLATIEERERRTHEAQLLALVASGNPEEALGAL